jgi:hypothetical protein
MSETPNVQKIFERLDDSTDMVQALLRPVLIRAMQDPALMKSLGTHALWQHLAALGKLILNLPTDGVGPQLPPLQTYLNLAIGEDVDDAEEAYNFVRMLSSPLRERVEGGLSRTLRDSSIRSSDGPLSLLAMARLLAIALADVPFVAHVLDTGKADAFLPMSDHPLERPTPPRRKRKSREDSSHLQRFVGNFVEITAVVANLESEHSGHVYLMLGRVLEISPNHVILQSSFPGSPEGETVLIGLAHVVAMRRLSASSS